jgi:hypothetical protein
VKSKGRAKWRRFYADNYGHPCNQETAVWLLFEPWDELSDSVMIADWDFNKNESDSDSEDSDDGFELRVDTEGEDLNDELDMEEEEEDNEVRGKEPQPQETPILQMSGNVHKINIHLSRKSSRGETTPSIAKNRQTSPQGIIFSKPLLTSVNGSSMDIKIYESIADDE